MPIPNIIIVKPQIDNWGVTQLKELGFQSPIRHPKATHTGKAVESASLRDSRNPLNWDLVLALDMFDELPQRRCVECLTPLASLGVRKCPSVAGNEMSFLGCVGKS